MSKPPSGKKEKEELSWESGPDPSSFTAPENFPFKDDVDIKKAGPPPAPTAAAATSGSTKPPQTAAAATATASKPSPAKPSPSKQQPPAKKK